MLSSVLCVKDTAWHNANVEGRIREITVCRAQLVLRWVTISFRGYAIWVRNPGQLSLLPSAGWEMSTCSRVVNTGAAQYHLRINV